MFVFEIVVLTDDAMTIYVSRQWRYKCKFEACEVSAARALALLSTSSTHDLIN